MPLHVPPAPAPALRSVLTALGSPSAVREARVPDIPDIPAVPGVPAVPDIPAVSAVRAVPSLLSAEGPVTAELPLPVHVLDQVMPQGDRRPRTRLAGWRFLIRCGDRAIAAADTMPTPDGWALSHFFEGPYITSTEMALQQAEALPGDYQPRLLSVPELYMLTLWLRGDHETDPAEGEPAPADLLVPLAPAPPGIAAHRPRRVADLLPVMTSRVAPVPLLGFPA
ncbi:hypothetical protein SSP531S_05370 [Streptomyces spongiicola]|uniref:Uncharacterized protein n=1 Tax=Streptomyces spongiicola TaxID=1690221 RepID=A0A388SR73_9ACTN|nr:hypothetical protein [Streptomyces spongiicola]GBP99142.1 hypothetical protein SSP531S_05370 [Streptomyces spongiicola]